MDELVAFVRAQLDAAEARTCKLLADAQRTALTLQDPRHLGKFIPGWHDWPDVEQMCTERLADIVRQRAILDLHQAEPGQHPDFCRADMQQLPCPTVLTLFAPGLIERR